MKATHKIGSILTLPIVLIGGQYHLLAASVEGALTVWSPVTITFTDKEASETETTFRDHRLDVLFRQGGTEKKDTYLYEDHGFGAGKGVGLHRYLFHQKHWNEGDPTWQVMTVGGEARSLVNPPSDPVSSWAALVLPIN